MIFGNPAAYVFLGKHGALIKQLPNKSVILTMDGRVWLITFLMFHDYLTAESFHHVSENLEQIPARVAYETGRMLRKVCQKWLTDNKENMEKHPKRLVAPTDLSYGQISLLMNLLVTAQENLERAAQGQKP